MATGCYRPSWVAAFVGADLSRLVQLRTDRQQRLTATDFRLTTVINEAALHRWVGGREVMHA